MNASPVDLLYDAYLDKASEDMPIPRLTSEQLAAFHGLKLLTVRSWEKYRVVPQDAQYKGIRHRHYDVFSRRWYHRVNPGVSTMKQINNHSTDPCIDLLNDAYLDEASEDMPIPKLTSEQLAVFHSLKLPTMKYWEKKGSVPNKEKYKEIQHRRYDPELSRWCVD